MMRIGILGYGEIGKAIHQLYLADEKFNIFVKDIERNDGLISLDVLNVSIPYNESFDFVEAVVQNVIESCAKVVIIHSTVAIGTTSKIKERLPNTIVAHSPCRGVHPHLYEGLLTFEKLIGSPVHADATKVSEHFDFLRIKNRVCKNAETSELAKLLDTSYYGLCIAYHGEALKACEHFDADFSDVMTFYNSTYNDGYKKLGKTNVVRPVLTPPTNGIGGHCVIQNAELLDKQFKSIALDLILKYKV
jgi:UDP-N-acetyl-D-mannosaminuronate dehydrogenase